MWYLTITSYLKKKCITNRYNRIHCCNFGRNCSCCCDSSIRHWCWKCWSLHCARRSHSLCHTTNDISGRSETANLLWQPFSVQLLFWASRIFVSIPHRLGCTLKSLSISFANGYHHISSNSNRLFLEPNSTKASSIVQSIDCEHELCWSI